MCEVTPWRPCLQTRCIWGRCPGRCSPVAWPRSSSRSQTLSAVLGGVLWRAYSFLTDCFFRSERSDSVLTRGHTRLRFCYIVRMRNSRQKMVDEATKKRLASIPLLRTRAGPRDGDQWATRLKEEYTSLIQVTLYPIRPLLPHYLSLPLSVTST